MPPSIALLFFVMKGEFMSVLEFIEADLLGLNEFTVPDAIKSRGSTMGKLLQKLSGPGMTITSFRKITAGTEIKDMFNFLLMIEVPPHTPQAKIIDSHDNAVKMFFDNTKGLPSMIGEVIVV